MTRFVGPSWAFRCQECGKAFRTVRATERAMRYGCPGCGGADIDYSPPVVRDGDTRPATEPVRDSLHREGL